MNLRIPSNIDLAKKYVVLDSPKNRTGSYEVKTYDKNNLPANSIVQLDKISNILKDWKPANDIEIKVANKLNQAINSHNRKVKWLNWFGDSLVAFLTNYFPCLRTYENVGQSFQLEASPFIFNKVSKKIRPDIVFFGKPILFPESVLSKMPPKHYVCITTITSRIEEEKLKKINDYINEQVDKSIVIIVAQYGQIPENVPPLECKNFKLSKKTYPILSLYYDEEGILDHEANIKNIKDIV